MSETWTPNMSAPLWDSHEEGEPCGPFFHNLDIRHIKQSGPSCVPTTLAMLAKATGADVNPEDFMPLINSQSPHTWSKSLEPYGLQLAYCNQDVRRLEYYIDELVEYDDLFLICFYSKTPPSDPDVNGKLCTAHIVTLHKGVIIDTAKRGNYSVCKAIDYPRLGRETKRIFRVVPKGHPRCL
ncbi:MAG TPA: hypothetical protein QF802_06515 [Candidatus Thalassarchaeaceae archaeon]|nr:hypothetical protein [Candidatus Thalassarchaeaceae archaeon]